MIRLRGLSETVELSIDEALLVGLDLGYQGKHFSAVKLLLMGCALVQPEQPPMHDLEGRGLHVDQDTQRPILGRQQRTARQVVYRRPEALHRPPQSKHGTGWSARPSPGGRAGRLGLEFPAQHEAISANPVSGHSSSRYARQGKVSAKKLDACSPIESGFAVCMRGDRNGRLSSTLI
jgi:hypothetical protein